MRYLEFIVLSMLMVITLSCNSGEVITTFLPPEIVAKKYTYRVVEGGEISISPKYRYVEDATYSWRIDECEVCSDDSYTFIAEDVGAVTIMLTVTTSGGEVEATFMVEVFEHVKVYDYTPAPGQFIGDTPRGGFTGEESTPQHAIEYAERRLSEEQFISLGAFGGYIVIGLEHRITNDEGYDFAIRGNAHEGSSEPGIVHVMQDDNGNGLPDDTWYELAGSETGKEETLSNYAVTYYRPQEDGASVAWSDNMGGSGSVEYSEEFHTQRSYYPQWITTDNYTLSGRRLASRSYDKSGNGSLWINPAFEWGYADNLSTQDFEGGENSFDIDNAIDEEERSVELAHIDFIKVQSAIQQQCGRIGELSTEISALREL